MGSADRLTIAATIAAYEWGNAPVRRFTDLLKTAHWYCRLSTVPLPPRRLAAGSPVAPWALHLCDQNGDPPKAMALT